jgi:hypothetical protein
MISAAWILGVFFFVFLFAAIAFILATNPGQPVVAPPRYEDATVNKDKGGNRRIARDFQIEFSPQAFVNYPFGLSVVFPAKPSNSEPVAFQRTFQASDYIRWRRPDQDPHLIVKRGSIEFETEDTEPIIRVELRFAAESFEASATVAEVVLRRNQHAACSLSLNPLKAQASALTVVISRTARNGQPGAELATVSLVVPVEHFPIRLR